MQYFNIVNATGSHGSNQTQMGIGGHYKNEPREWCRLLCRFSRMTTANAEVRVRRISNGAGTPWLP
jgi:hypothetical protein